MNWTKSKSWLIYIENITIIVYIVLVLGALPFADLAITGGVLLGGAIGWANFALLIRIGDKVFANPDKPEPSYLAFSWIKFAIVIVILFFTVRSGMFNGIALLVGYSNYVLAIFIGTILWYLKQKLGRADGKVQGKKP